MHDFVKRYVNHVLRRSTFVFICLGTGLLGWPGDTGAQESLLNSGSIDASGARRISVPVRSDEGGGSFAERISQAVGGLKDQFGGGESDSGDVARIKMENPNATAGMSAPGRAEVAMIQALNQMAGLPEGTPTIADLNADSSLLETLQIMHAAPENAMARAAAFGQMMDQMEAPQRAAAKAKRLKVEAEKASRPPTVGERLFAEYGERAPSQTPYLISRAALAAR